MNWLRRLLFGFNPRAVLTYQALIWHDLQELQDSVDSIRRKCRRIENHLKVRAELSELTRKLREAKQSLADAVAASGGESRTPPEVPS